jgi:hypothetical protein
MDKKKLLIYGLTIGGLGLAGYYIYEYFTKRQPQIINIYTGQTVSNPSTLPGFTGNGIPGTIYISTSVPPYSTIYFAYSLANMPFSVDVYAGWLGSQPVNVEITGTLWLLDYQAKVFNYFVVSQKTLNVPIAIGPLKATINSYTRVKIPISGNLLDVSTIQDELQQLFLTLLDKIVFTYFYFNALLELNIFVNGIYAGTYKENFTFVESPI